MSDYRGQGSPEPKRSSRGRGHRPRAKVSPTHPGDASTSAAGRSRAGSNSPVEQMGAVSLQEKMTCVTEGPVEVITTDKDGASRRGHRRGTLQTFEPHTRPQSLECKQGKAGTPLALLANYFALNKSCTWALFQHRIDFNPLEDNEKVRKMLVRSHKEYLGAYMFDGQMLYSVKNQAPDGTPVSLYSEKKTDKTQVEIKIRMVGKVEPKDPIYMQFYNLIIRKCLYGLDLEPMGRNFFDRHAAIEIPAHRLTLWPGYVTAMRAHEKDTMLCVEVTHKVLRLDNVLSMINGLRNNRDFRDAVGQEIIGSIVMTSYNRKTYRVDDIEWNVSPMNTFDCKGTQTTYMEYYETRYNIKISDRNQPLLVVRPREREKHQGVIQNIYLIPETCQMTGLSDAMRANFGLMKDLSQHLHMAPAKRVDAVNGFMRRLRNSPEITAEMEKWEVQFDPKMTTCPGRLMPRESIVFAGPGKPEPANDKADWTMAFRSRQMVTTVNLDRWLIFVPQREAANVDNLVRTMCNVAKPLNFIIRPPLEIIKIMNIQPVSYVNAIDEAIRKYSGKLQMLFVILPNNKLDLYSHVKKRLSVDMGIPSQCFLAKNVTSKGLMSIATKVVIQMNAKLGGQPWSIQLPLKGLMFVGFDVYHGARGTHGKSVGALVSTTSANFASYFSITSIHNGRVELANNLTSDIKKCVDAYKNKNGYFPEQIILFRDGVGDGDLEYVYETELTQLNRGLMEYYETEGLPPPKFTFIVVTKKINTRLFTAGPKPENPPPGTIVDDVITLPERYDFFLVAQAARQGTVSPCSFNVLLDGSGLEVDKIQRITYKMCHMYFNWSGTVAVPAPCQYAHKLAALTGIALGSQPVNSDLQHLLHFL